MTNPAVLAQEAKLALRLAEVAARESREQLNTLMGLWGEEAQAWIPASVRLPDPGEPPDLARLESRAIEQQIRNPKSEIRNKAATCDRSNTGPDVCVAMVFVSDWRLFRISCFGFRI